MITVQEIKQKALQQYKSFLKFVISETLNETIVHDNTLNKSFFPLYIPSNKGKATDNILTRSTEIKNLLDNCKNNVGFGYQMTTKEITTRNNGKQTIISSIYFDHEEDFIKFISKTTEIVRFRLAIKTILENILPSVKESLYPWLQKHFQELCNFHEPGFWKNISSCINWFYENPKSGLFIREIPLSVHTKFIEQNISLINSFFDTNVEDGLKQIPTLFQCRPLCNTIPFIEGMNFPEVLSLTSSDLNNFLTTNILQSIQTIVIVENKMIFHTFPTMDNALCIWGSGYQVLMLEHCVSLNTRQILYFGDIDEHGFDILSKFRNYFPLTKSFCMDKATLDKFSEFRVASNKKPITLPTNLSETEKQVFSELQKNSKQNRLEQERITQEFIINNLQLHLKLSASN